MTLSTKVVVCILKSRRTARVKWTLCSHAELLRLNGRRHRACMCSSEERFVLGCTYAHDKKPYSTRSSMHSTSDRSAHFRGTSKHRGVTPSMQALRTSSIATAQRLRTSLSLEPRPVGGRQCGPLVRLSLSSASAVAWNRGWSRRGQTPWWVAPPRLVLYPVACRTSAVSPRSTRVGAATGTEHQRWWWWHTSYPRVFRFLTWACW